MQFLRNWWWGVRKISKGTARSVNSPKCKGILLEAMPSRDVPDFKAIPLMLDACHHPRKKRLLERVMPWRVRTSHTFEIWSWNHNVRFLTWSRNIETMRRFINGINVLYPQSHITRASGNPFRVSPGEFVCSGTVKASLLNSVHSIRRFHSDPMNYVLETMSRLDSKSILQVFFKPMEPTKRIHEELKNPPSCPLFEAYLRYSCIAKSPGQAYYSAKILGDALKVFENVQFKRRLFKKTIPFFRDSARALRQACSRKYPRLWGDKFLLASQELATLVHLPVDYMGRGLMKAEESLPPPPLEELRRRNDIRIGDIFFRGRKLESVSLSLEELMRGQYIVGGSGTGKTVLMINEILQAWRKGLCVHVLDPHGDMSYDILKRIDPKEAERVFLLDPLSVGYSLNPFEIPDGEKKFGAERDIVVERLVGEITEMMKRLFGRQYWGPSLNRTFQNAARMLYREGDNPTFVEIYQMLRGHGEIAQKEHVKPFVREIRALPIERLDAVLNKLDPFVKNKLLRSIFCNKVSTVDFSKLVRPGQLVIWRLPKGELSETNMSLIGSTLVTKLWYHVVSKGIEERVPMLAAIDEFQNFAALETLESVLTEGRKFGMGLMLAHQSVKQIPMDVFRIALGNTSVKTVFRVSGEDGMVLARTLNPEQAQLIRNIVTSLPDGSAVVKLKSGFGERPLRAFQMTTRPLQEETFHDVDSIVRRMREEFKAPVLGEPQVKEETAISPEVYDLLRIVNWMHDTGGEPNIGNTLKELRKLYSGMRGSRLSQVIDIAQSYGLVTRNVVKQKRGRPKIILKLTEKGMKEGLAMGTGSGSSTKGGGELHRAMVQRMADFLRGKGCLVVPEEQGGKAEQPDLTAWIRSSDGGKWERELAFEFETTAKHPEQVWKNFEKNVKKGREVIFIVPDRKIKEKVEGILGDYRKNARIEVMEEFRLK